MAQHEGKWTWRNRQRVCHETHIQRRSKQDVRRTALPAGILGWDRACLTKMSLGNVYLGQGIKRGSSLFNADDIKPRSKAPQVEGQRKMLRYVHLIDSTKPIWNTRPKPISAGSPRTNCPKRWPAGQRGLEGHSSC